MAVGVGGVTFASVGPCACAGRGVTAPRAKAIIDVTVNGFNLLKGIIKKV